ncbi:MAG: hypothetical protein IPP31_08930 [Chitinophagaceae bacterium]|nr:hypothetical protein [Chitinophagaceae bacterium]
MRIRNIFIFISGFVISAILAHFKGDGWENGLRALLYRVSGDSIPGFATVYTDTNGIPYVYYAPQQGIAPGNQLNSTLVANYALDYDDAFLEKHDPGDREKFWHCTNRLSDSMHDHSGIGQYFFYWQQPWYPDVGIPFTSGMTSGRAMEAFVRAFRISGDSIWLDRSARLLRGFYIPVQHGGFTYPEKDGWWFEELADSMGKTPRILDGHIYALLGVRNYWEQTKDDSARFVLTKGLEALKAHLPDYDAGHGKVYYDNQQKIADQHYHELLAGLMQELFGMTGDPIYNTYYKKWSAPLKETYLLRIIRQGNRSGLLLITLLTLAISGLILAGVRLLSRRR